MMYTVKHGDTLWKTAAEQFGDPDKWRVIATDNLLRSPDRILIGQHLRIRDNFVKSRVVEHSGRLLQAINMQLQQTSPEHAKSLIPARGFFFVIADEFNPLRQKVVRKVITSEKIANELSKRIGKTIKTIPNPEQFGFLPSDPLSKLPVGRHALGMKPSPYSSASSKPLGAPRIEGRRFWIDVEKARQAGATFHDAEEILADLDRIANKSGNAKTLQKISEVRKFVAADAEVLAKGAIPASAIKGAGSMALTRSMQGIQIVGFAMTAVDLYSAGKKSVDQNSVKPMAAESVRQAGGWAAGWAGAKLGAAGAAALGIETGPFDIAIGLAGGIVGGVAGYYGFDWIADHIDEN